MFKKIDEMHMHITFRALRLQSMFYQLALLSLVFYEGIILRELTTAFIILIAGNMIFFSTQYVLAKKRQKIMENKLKAFRNRAGFTQQELAHRVDVSSRTIAAIENGHYKPTLELALKISKQLGEPIERIFAID
ncbi:helix-turn-helix transcriptional regulator [Polycladospora coralii]|nr:helix-turn-helix transcriptional regulator [Polycladospora coralii]